MALRNLYTRYRAATHLLLGAALGFAIGLLVGWQLRQHQPNEDLLVQTASMEEVNGMGEFQFYYPRHYVSPPALHIVANASLWSYKITEQSEKGFRILVKDAYSDAWPKPRYEATGVADK